MATRSVSPSTRAPRVLLLLAASACAPSWEVLDAPAIGSLSGVWGAGPDDVFVVGGDDSGGAVLHGDVAGLAAMDVPATGLLVWVYGFAPDDVFAVGRDGAALHYDGSAWTVLDPGTDEDLWGVWGSSPTDVWVVGGATTDTDASPVLLHYDGAAFTPYTLDAADNPAGANALFKVWGLGGTVFAVGAKGLIVQWDGSAWHRTDAGATDDFVSLWGTASDHVVAVGGRSIAQVATWDGTAWTTTNPTRPDGSGLPIVGLNAVTMADAGTAIVGGLQGWVGTFDPTDGTWVDEGYQAAVTVHATWDDGAGTTWAVGGTFTAPHTGQILLRR
ncbi:MAG: hypothetical protein H6733_03080 [Alphaproteobacteria bacterium]|nr:hypothetical protein [Alphaproteobacteria bacterium]